MFGFVKVWIKGVQISKGLLELYLDVLDADPVPCKLTATVTGIPRSPAPPGENNTVTDAEEEDSDISITGGSN